MKITNVYTIESLLSRYVDLFYAAKKLPTERALSYQTFKKFVRNTVEEAIEIIDKSRKEVGMPESLGFDPVPEEETEEQTAEKAQQAANLKAELAKKNK